MMDAHCEGCENRGPYSRCYALAANNPRLCELAATREDYRALVRRKTLAGETPPPPPYGFTPHPTPHPTPHLARYAYGHGYSYGNSTPHRAPHGDAPPTPPPRALPPGTLVVRGHGDSSVGYGRMLAHAMKALEAQGVPTAFSPLTVEEGRVPLDPFLAARRIERGRDGPCLQLSSAGPVPPGSVLWTMWESSVLPAAQVEACNTARFVVVPCDWAAGVFRDSGVTAPVRVVPLGVDTSAYFPGGAEARGRFTALNVARMAHGGARKGVADLVAAFLEALGDRPDAWLHLKLWPDCDLPDPGHPRVVLDRSSYDDAGMRALYSSASVYATMTRGEGWGMPPHEAMACGRAYVGPIHTGLSAFVQPSCAYPVDWDHAPGGGAFYSGHGEWCVSRHKSMVAQLRAAYRDPSGRRVRGTRAAARAAEFPWSRSAAALLPVLREAGLVAPPPARAPARPAALQARLAVLRNACPSGKAAGCGCQDLKACSKLGREVAREDCYLCIEATMAPSSSPAPAGT